MLSERRQRILNLVVGAYLESGKPVSSAAIADDPAVEWGPSTVRAELAALEHEGYLGHPHTSAGRVPTDSGYRFYADALVSAEARPGPASGLLDLSILQTDKYEEVLRQAVSKLWAGEDPKAILDQAAAEWDAITEKIGVDKQKAVYKDWAAKAGAYPKM